MKATRRLKRIACILLMVSMLILETSAAFAAEADAEEPVIVSMEQLNDFEQYDTDGDGQITAVIVPSAAMLTATIRSGTVVGDGVRLRVAASTSATVMELMYYGETVSVYYNMVTADGICWYRVTRAKTGTTGWAGADYISGPF